ncbi:hypothetical protein M406DRAFT_68200 [Cryphonectria parasitica EP155]|uniref:Uncharacterized protein n=1 Tax=Cryphonectria parasitica (strain ATCC 38755 / EP155) TaxID=660469 RepID=A0A9P4Y3C8_CRYP1|nr:uncharacterized protein M406DRAFT_68200 [Cryphonectria parasitica EP155]KAF3765791.1 hypothetical protein M406DRAFT_68200 [Cryphonectria parasitica EP155]
MSFSFSVLTAMILICLAGFLMGLRAFDYASEHGDLGENRQNRAPRGYGSTLTHMQTVYLEGNPYATRTAEPSYVITVDVRHSLWGFCPFTVVKAEQCGLAGGCIVITVSHQAHSTYSTQPGRAYCSTALLTLANSEGPYTYLACGESPATEQYLAVPTAEATVTPTRTNFPTITVISTMPPGYTYDPQMFAGFNATHLPFELSVSPGVLAIMPNSEE